MKPRWRTPKTNAAATTLLERVAELDGSLALINAARSDAIAKANAQADAEAEPLLKERADIVTGLEPWWNTAAAELTAGKRKSIELGGCMIGTRLSTAGLDVAGDEKAIVAKLQRRKWAAGLFRITPSLDRKALLKATTGQYKKQLAALGLRPKVQQDIFFVERAEQAGTRAGA